MEGVWLRVVNGVELAVGWNYEDAKPDHGNEDDRNDERRGGRRRLARTKFRVHDV